MEAGSIRGKRIAETHLSVLQTARHRQQHRRRRPEFGDPLEIPARGEVHARRPESELRGKDALDAEVRHSAPVHDAAVT